MCVFLFFSHIRSLEIHQRNMFVTNELCDLHDFRCVCKCLNLWLAWLLRFWVKLVDFRLTILFVYLLYIYLLSCLKKKRKKTKLDSEQFGTLCARSSVDMLNFLCSCENEFVQKMIGFLSLKIAGFFLFAKFTTTLFVNVVAHRNSFQNTSRSVFDRFFLNDSHAFMRGFFVSGFFIWFQAVNFSIRLFAVYFFRIILMKKTDSWSIKLFFAHRVCLTSGASRQKKNTFAFTPTLVVGGVLMCFICCSSLFNEINHIVVFCFVFITFFLCVCA